MLASFKKRLAVALSVAFLSTFTGLAARAGIIREDQSALTKEIPLYCWRDDSRQPRAVAVAVHGLTMHGGVFDTMARQLAADGIVVYAPDLRGFGRWLSDANYKDKTAGVIDYETSYEDVTKLVRKVKAEHPDVPLFCIGESLGADLVLRAAGELPDAMDGIVLSSPAVKTHSFIWPMVELSGPVMMNPKKQMNLVRYIRKFASEDPHIVHGALSDPLVRKRLSAVDLLHTSVTCKPALEYAKKVPENVSVLVIQGKQDRMIKAKAVIKLVSQLKSHDQTVRWFPDRGHLLIETSYVRSDTLETIQDWLGQRVRKVEVAKGKPDTLKTERFITSPALLETLSLARTTMEP